MIEKLNNRYELWDEYVFKNSRGTVYHTINWMKAVEKAFKKENDYYLYIEDNVIKGVLPIFLIKTLFSGKKAVSIPWAMYGDILADTESIRMKLLEFAKNEVAKNDIDFLELRQLNEDNYSLSKLDLYVTYIKEIEENDDAILKSIPRKSRASIRNGYKKFNLTTKVSANIDIMYRLYLLNKRKLGSPPYSKIFMQSLLDGFNKNAGILYVYYENKPIAGVIYFIYKDTIYPYFSGADNSYNFTNSNNVLYYELMKFAISKKIKYFDFGRSRINTGAGKFKKNMGFEAQALYYYIYSPKHKDIPNISPSNKKFHFFTKTWSKLPLFVTELVGPHIVKRIP